jgi:AmmeMemoRadiSam system protein B
VLQASRQRDQAILSDLAAADPTALFRTIAAEGDARRICGLPPVWLALQAARPRRGHVLDYRQALHPTGHESVSFASVAFDA